MNYIPADDRHPFKYYYDENATLVLLQMVNSTKAL